MFWPFHAMWCQHVSNCNYTQLLHDLYNCISFYYMSIEDIGHYLFIHQIPFQTTHNPLTYIAIVKLFSCFLLDSHICALCDYKTILLLTCGSFVVTLLNWTLILEWYFGTTCNCMSFHMLPRLPPSLSKC